MMKSLDGSSIYKAMLTHKSNIKYQGKVTLYNMIEVAQTKPIRMVYALDKREPDLSKNVFKLSRKGKTNAVKGIVNEKEWKSEYRKIHKRCIFCKGLLPPAKDCVIDHDHTKGLIRGLAHRLCNGMEGSFMAGVGWLLGLNWVSNMEHQLVMLTAMRKVDMQRISPTV